MSVDELNQTMATTRDFVLKTLLTKQQCTINELADAVGINPISVRHHVTKLEASGLVSSEEERHGVGRPRRLYFLTEKGVEQFPTRYLRLTVRLLSQMKETLPESIVNRLFTQMAEDLVEEFSTDLNLEDLPIEEKLDIVQELLSSEGFTIQWEHKDDAYLIQETSCPYYHVGQSHPEICAVDQTLISNVLSTPVEKVTCVLQGDSYCTYVVQKSNGAEQE
jgi:predicted ArsR family transcriptional regulator